jgi:hypothetical protein
MSDSVDIASPIVCRNGAMPVRRPQHVADAVSRGADFDGEIRAEPQHVKMLPMSRGHNGGKRIVSVHTDAVWIETGRMLWSNLTPAIRKVLLDGVERIAAVREALGQSAKVLFLPPIQIKCELWINEDMAASITGVD